VTFIWHCVCKFSKKYCRDLNLLQIELQNFSIESQIKLHRFKLNLYGANQIARTVQIIT